MIIQGHIFFSVHFIIYHPGTHIAGAISILYISKCNTKYVLKPYSQRFGNMIIGMIGMELFRPKKLLKITPPHNNGGVLWFHIGRPCVRPSVLRPSGFRFRITTWVNINGFSWNLVRALILWRSGLGLLMGKFCQIWTELSARDTPIFLFPNDNLSK